MDSLIAASAASASLNPRKQGVCAPLKSISTLDRAALVLTNHAWGVTHHGKWGLSFGTLWASMLLQYDPQGGLEVARLEVDPSQRANRHGSLLMEVVCDTADRLYCPLSLWAMPLKSATGPLADRYALAVWYATFGFEPLREEFLRIRMRRYPIWLGAEAFK